MRFVVSELQVELKTATLRDRLRANEACVAPNAVHVSVASAESRR
jgi:chemotaxis response regulator CheB